MLASIRQRLSDYYAATAQPLIEMAVAVGNSLATLDVYGGYGNRALVCW